MRSPRGGGFGQRGALRIRGLFAVFGGGVAGEPLAHRRSSRRAVGRLADSASTPPWWRRRLRRRDPSLEQVPYRPSEGPRSHVPVLQRLHLGQLGGPVLGATQRHQPKPVGFPAKEEQIECEKQDSSPLFATFDAVLFLSLPIH